MELFAPMHILVILLIMVLLFGPKKLPEMGRALGEGIREFKKAMKEAANSEENPNAAIKSTETGSEISKQ